MSKLVNKRQINNANLTSTLKQYRAVVSKIQNILTTFLSLSFNNICHPLTNDNIDKMLKKKIQVTNDFNNIIKTNKEIIFIGTILC